MNEATTPNIIPINVPNMDTTKKEPIARPTCVQKKLRKNLGFSKIILILRVFENYTAYTF